MNDSTKIRQHALIQNLKPAGFLLQFSARPRLASFEVPAPSWDKGRRSQIYTSQRELEGTEAKVGDGGGSGAHERHSDDAFLVVLVLVSLEL
jgi:hypothetical protein